MVANLRICCMLKRKEIDQVPIKNLKPVPIHNKDIFDEKTAVLKLEEKGEIIEDSATQLGDQDDTQGILWLRTPCPLGAVRV